MFQESSSGVSLYDCPRLNARISAEQCRINKERSGKMTVHEEHVNAVILRACLDCKGVTGEFKEEPRSRFAGKIQCSSCRAHFSPEEFRVSDVTGKRIARCPRCDDYQRRRAEKQRKPPKPPRVAFHNGTQTTLNVSAVRQFDLGQCSYITVFELDGELYIAGSDEKKPGYYKVVAKGGQRSCSARALHRAVGIDCSMVFELEQTEERAVFKLVANR